MNRLIIFAVLFAMTGCGGGGSGSAPPVLHLAGSYYGTVVSSIDNSGNMGITTDEFGNGSFAVQYPGEAVFAETFAPPVSSVIGSTLHISGTIDGCNFKLNASMADENTLKGTYNLTCPSGQGGSARFSLPRGSYSINSIAHQIAPQG